MREEKVILDRDAEYEARLASHTARKYIGGCFWLLASATTLLFPLGTHAQARERKPVSLSQPSPRPALPAILHAFDTYEVVGMSEAHDMKDVDDLILSLVREPSFPDRVNDITVECGNSLYQATLDRYIAGEKVDFSEVQKVWRNTTQPMCGLSGFFEQLFPLIRAVNQRLPVQKRLRVLAADPPIDWDKVQSSKDIAPFMERDAGIASVMEKEVLSKHRKALMLFGIFHLLHGAGPGNGDAVTLYEKHYPGHTFIISDFGYYGADQEARPGDSGDPLDAWPNPSLVEAKSTSLGALSLSLSDFLPTPITTDEHCNVVDAFTNKPRPVAELIDAFLYLGPQHLRLKEKIPADIALDTRYMTEWLRRNVLAGLPETKTLEELTQQTVSGAADPILVVPRLPDAKQFYPFIKKSCLERHAQEPAEQTQ